MSKASDIKNEIKTLFTSLQYTGHAPETGIVGDIIEDDFKVSNPFDREISAYPAIIINPPAISISTAYDNIRNVRTYTFVIGVIMKGDDISTVTQLEEFTEALMDKLDNNPTLGGYCDAGVEPSTTSPEPHTDRGKSYIVFAITLKAKAIMTLT